MAIGVITLGTVGTIATAMGHGPLVSQGLDTDGRIAMLQIYLAGGCLMTIPMCLLVAERRRLAARLRESERGYRMLAEHA